MAGGKDRGFAILESAKRAEILINEKSYPNSTTDSNSNEYLKSSDLSSTAAVKVTVLDDSESKEDLPDYGTYYSKWKEIFAEYLGGDEDLLSADEKITPTEYADSNNPEGMTLKNDGMISFTKTRLYKARHGVRVMYGLGKSETESASEYDSDIPQALERVLLSNGNELR